MSSWHEVNSALNKSCKSVLDAMHMPGFMFVDRDLYFPISDGTIESLFPMDHVLVDLVQNHERLELRGKTRAV